MSRPRYVAGRRPMDAPSATSFRWGILGIKEKRIRVGSNLEPFALQPSVLTIWPRMLRPWPGLKGRRHKVEKRGEKKENFLRRMDNQMRRSLKVNFRCNYDIQKSTSVTCRISVNFGFDQSWIKRR